MTKIRLVGNRILVRPLKLATHSPGGIAYPDTPQYRDDATQFEVLAVGPGRKLKDGSILPMEIQPGDHVFCPLWKDSLHVFDDGRLIVGAEQVQAKWSPTP